MPVSKKGGVTRKVASNTKGNKSKQSSSSQTLIKNVATKKKVRIPKGGGGIERANYLAVSFRCAH